MLTQQEAPANDKSGKKKGKKGESGGGKKGKGGGKSKGDFEPAARRVEFLLTQASQALDMDSPAGNVSAHMRVIWP
jgi:hypothetical protein